ncbi:hypothetical protein [Streptomyces roseochromogenus]|uniref:Gram-positive cocci surface proteins LPxTG domain-containing protein n=1 Tax=Streptomyces roseochromogenus subsp. oscitans DS 12.976 TaxID=1352936 RepID=V6K1J5_STRRC|nr:hypothetical protein [Streptomyces roseochromogenus]EST25251.1 hypothetical protein M878_29255 [Streptomyces roseochromogenus subsp. oscitans DS 12.976]
MAILHRRNLARTTATAALVGSALLLPAAAAFADSPVAPVTDSSGAPSYPADKPAPSVPDKPESGAPSYPADKPTEKPAPSVPSQKPESKPGTSAEALKITKKVSGKGVITYTLSSGDKAQLSWTPDGSPSAKLTGGGAEGHLGFPAPAEQSLVSKTGVEFTLMIPATGKEGPWVEATKGKDSLRLEFPAEPTSGKADKGKGSGSKGQGRTVPKGGVKAGAEDVQQGDGTLLMAGGGAAAAAAGLGFAVLRRRKADSRI